MNETLPFSCPVCGRKTEHSLAELFEGAMLTCPFCGLTLKLHGHMWRDVQKEMDQVRKKPGGAPP